MTLPNDSLVRLQALATDFAAYPELGDAGRRRLVTGTRQWLHGLRARLEPSAPMAPPRIRVSSSPEASGGSAALPCTLDLESPLARVHGIGPKLAERLASLGLLVVRDLIQHYPRDYVDYSALRRIEALEAGETATIVATVRRSHGFTSPRNPNLSIIELQLQDPTGRIKVTRFLAGKRFSNPAYLHGQTRQYPAGATVAVSGLVKSGPYGVSFQDPIIEVMESANAPLRSRQIGRLLPVYPLTEGLTADRFRSLVEAVLPAVRLWPDPLSSGAIAMRPKKEGAVLRRELERLQKYLGGLKNMRRIPDVVVLVDQRRETNAVLEARKLDISLVSMLDTNCDPDLCEVPIPCNDDAVRSIQLVLSRLADAINEGRHGGQDGRGDDGRTCVFVPGRIVLKWLRDITFPPRCL